MNPVLPIDHRIIDMACRDPLTANRNLFDLLFELREHSVLLTIGGGFGLYLKSIQSDMSTTEVRNVR
jgi:hypothetical protein